MDKIRLLMEIATLPDNVERAVKFISFSLMIAGVIILYYKEIQEIRREYKERHSNTKLGKKQIALDKYLSDLLVANNVPEYITARIWRNVSVGVFVIVLILSVHVFIPTAALINSVTIAILPTVILRVNLEKNRAEASHDAETLVNELLVKYRAKNYNMEEALEEVAKSKNLGKSKKPLIRLTLKLRNSRYESDVKEAIDTFSYAIKTNWAKMLGSNIYQAKVSGENVAVSLEDIMIQLREARRIWEVQKRSSAEPKRLLWFIPILYGMFVYMTVSVVGVPIKDYIKNQFFTSQGLSMFSLILIGFFSSIAFTTLVFSRKFDF